MKGIWMNLGARSKSCLSRKRSRRGNRLRAVPEVPTKTSLRKGPTSPQPAPPGAGHYPQLLHTRAVLSAREGRCFGVPKGQSRIAQRFNAGLDAERSRVPKGRPRSTPTRLPSAVPSGLVCHARRFPALKRRAILKMSLQDKGIGWPHSPARRQTDSRAMPSRPFRGSGFRPGRFATRSCPRCPAKKMWDTLSPGEGKPSRFTLSVRPGAEPPHGDLRKRQSFGDLWARRVQLS